MFMKKQIIILLLALIIPCAAFAQGYTERQPAFGATAPSVSFRSTSGAYMSTGSAYSSTVHEVGSYSPAAHAYGSRPRKSGFNDITTGEATGEGGYDPNNPNLPLGDAILPLMLMALAYMVIRVRRKKRLSEHTSNS